MEYSGRGAAEMAACPLWTS